MSSQLFCQSSEAFFRWNRLDSLINTHWKYPGVFLFIFKRGSLPWLLSNGCYLQFGGERGVVVTFGFPLVASEIDVTLGGCYFWNSTVLRSTFSLGRFGCNFGVVVNVSSYRPP